MTIDASENRSGDLPAWTEPFREDRRAELARGRPFAPPTDRAWLESRGAGVTVAIVDSGVEGSHPAVGGRLTRSVRVEMEGDEAVGHGDCVHSGRAQVGVITSATRSPILNKTIALARVDVTHGELGTQLEVGKLDGQQKRLPARVVHFPHYDPDKIRVRS